MGKNSGKSIENGFSKSLDFQINFYDSFIQFSWNTDLHEKENYR